MEYEEFVTSKITSGKGLERLLNIWRFHDYTIVFTNGCFDILHFGHIQYLMKAAEMGDKLIIGLNSDNSVKRLKGKSRPLQDEKSRAMILASLIFVDLVIIFNEDTPYNIINLVKPDVLVKGGDYKIENIVGNDIVRAKGGKVISLDFKPGYSTTQIINKLTSN